MPAVRNNARLSFSGPGGAFALGCPVNKVAYRWEVVATESHAKRYRAMYPHQRSISQFALTMQLNGYNEMKRLINFIGTFSETAVYGSAQPMLVMVPSRNFMRLGFPIKGMMDHDHVGSMVFAPTIVFESVTDPLDPTVLSPNSQSVSQWDAAGTENDVKNFFYPFSRASYDTQVKPETVYDLDGAQNGTPWEPNAQGIVNQGNSAGGQLAGSIDQALDAAGRQ